MLYRIFTFVSTLALQNQDSQNYLRDQKRPQSVNMIAEISTTLDFLLRYFNLKMVKRSVDEGSNQTAGAFTWTKDFSKPASALLTDEVDATRIIELVDVLRVGFGTLKGKLLLYMWIHV